MKPESRATAGAGIVADPDEVARPVADSGAGLVGERREDQLSGLSGSHRLRAVGLQHLYEKGTS